MMENAKNKITEQKMLDQELFPIGCRVELAPHTDAWMSGDRFGEVENIGRFYLWVRMDRSKLIRKLTPDKIGRKVPIHEHFVARQYKEAEND